MYFPFQKPGFTKWPKTPRNDLLFRAKLLFWRAIRNSPLCRKAAFDCLNKAFKETTYDPTVAVEALSPQRVIRASDETVAIGDPSLTFDEGFGADDSSALIERRGMAGGARVAVQVRP